MPLAFLSIILYGYNKKIDIYEAFTEGAKEVSLGKRILRTETASISMLSMIMYKYDL